MGRQKELELGAPSDKVVAKANDLIRARHTLSTMEQRVFVLMIAKLGRESEFRVQEVSVREIAHNSDIDGSNVYRAAQDICDSLVDQTIDIHDRSDEGNRRYTSYSCFSMCQYEEGKGVIRAKFNEDMRPFLLELKRQFTLYLVTVFLRLRSKYSTRIYELLKMRQGISSFRLSVEELRATLRLQSKYKEFSQLKRRVIEQARKELRERADIYFTYQVIRDGRRAEEIQFFIHENEPVAEELDERISAMQETPESMSSRTRKNAFGYSTRAPTTVSEGTGALWVNAKKLFLEDLSQKELDRLTERKVNKLYSRAKSRVQEENPEATKSVIAYRTYSRMQRIWKSE